MSRKKMAKELQKESKPLELYFLVISAIIIIPLIFSSKTSDPNLAPRLLALGILVLVMSVFNITKAVKKRPDFSFIRMMVFPVFLLYLIWSLVALSQAVNPAEGSFDTIKTILFLSLLIFASQVLINNKEGFSFLVKAVIVSSVIATSIGVFQYFKEVPGNTGYDLLLALYKVKGLMGHKNQFVISLFLMLPFTMYGVFSFKKWWWRLSLYTTLMIFLNIVILQTRSVWVATLIFMLSFGFLWFFFSTKNKLKSSGMIKKLAIVVVVLVIVGLGSFLIFQKTGTLNLLKYKVTSLFDSKSHDNQGRIKIWEATWDLSQDNLVFGVGAGNWKIAVIPYYTVNHQSKYKNWHRPHNDFLWVLSEKGVLGLVLYLLLFLTVMFYGFKILFKETDKDKLLITALLLSGIGSYLVIALFTFPMERINPQIYVIIMMAGVISVYFKSKDISKPLEGKFYVSIQLTALVISLVSIYYANILINSEITTNKIHEAINAKKQRKVIEYSDKAFTKFTTVSFNAMPFHIYKGIANMRMKKYKQADKDLQTALGYFPNHIAVLSNLAIVSAERNNSKKAISYLEQSLELYPNFDDALYNLVNIYYRDKEYQKAYVTLLSCNTQKPHRDHANYLEELKSRVDLSSK